MRGTTSIYTRSLSDLARLAAKPFIAKVRLELISARFLLSRCFRLFQQNRPLADLKRSPAGGPRPFRAALRDRGLRAAPAYSGSKARYAMQSCRRAGQDRGPVRTAA